MILKKLFSCFISIVIVISTLTFSNSEHIFYATSVGNPDALTDFLLNSLQYHTYSASFEDSNEEPILFTNRLIVSVQPGHKLVDTTNAVSVMEAFDDWYLLQYSNVETTYLAQTYYSEQSYVRYVEYDTVIEPQSYEQTSSIDEVIFNWGMEQVESTEAISIISHSGLTIPQIIVGVIDTGVDTSHPMFSSLYGKIRFVPGNDEIDNKPTANNHGTKVAGVIVCNTPSNVKIKSYNSFYIEGKSYISTIKAQIEEAIVDKINVINISQGLYGKSDSLKEVIERAAYNNIPTVVSAGNDALDAGTHIASNIEATISVASVKKDLTPRSDSNFGKVVDISAPGENIITADLNNKYTYINKTSGAAPFVSAAAAMIKSIDPERTPAEIEDLIKATAYTPDGWDTKNYGTGIVNYMNILNTMLQITQAPEIEFIYNEKSNPEKAVINSSPNAKIYYTTNNTEPVVGKSALYTEPIDVTGLDIIKAIAVEDGMLPSETVSKTVDITVRKTVRYKGSLELHSAKRSDFKSCYVAKEDIVTYEGDGTIKAHKVGKTDVVVFVNCGKKVTYEITVEYEWWQRMIRIFLLGFLWY